MVITTANQGKKNFTGSRWVLKVKTRTLEARENTSDHRSIGIKFQSDWFRGSCEFSGPNVKRTEPKPVFTNYSRHSIENFSIKS